MTDDTSGMGASVGVRKMNNDGDIEEEKGVAKTEPSRGAWLLFVALVVLSSFGVWQILELVHIL